ncbi:2-amino-4-hydroxy-6-hydroxymethyldihydropteridine diphosphokinase [Phenylobacterium sp.]|uniref:2-amino-4-hydroxy-6- hydroxymethyldihydropteridine diphosphokinase n=1 Tax=Phenylobacterium sp. TaxID=1871053 RepID=UPI00286A2680|nr:2-amino-4-hydroxy-6-hydroxymethyldihydropteridine diphosphokinase [Phenylobacterium sp.]
MAVGGNLAGGFASCEALLEAALARLPEAGLPVLARSRWWRSAAWPDPEAPEYRNGVVLVEAQGDAHAVLAAIFAVERSFGRTRGAPNASRTLDLDLIAYGRQVIGDPELTLPHPRAHQRLFVMGPLAEIAPDWRHPLTGATAMDLANAASVGRDARPL